MTIRLATRGTKLKRRTPGWLRFTDERRLVVLALALVLLLGVYQNHASLSTFSSSKNAQYISSFQFNAKLLLPFEENLDVLQKDFNEILDESYSRYDIHGGLIGYFFFQNKLENPSLPLATVITKSNGTLLALNRQQHAILNNDTDDPDRSLLLRDPVKEQELCTQYNLNYNPNRTQPRRRIFYGATIADDSFYTLQTISTETYGVFHTVAFVESNTTHTRTQRNLRFVPGSTNLQLLQAMFGTRTKVSVDYFVDSFQLEDDGERGHKFNWQHMQRQGILHRWKRNGMQPGDLGILADTDELFSREALRALQTCDFPEFVLGHQDCNMPKILSRTIVFDASPECWKPGFLWSHPDVILGECIDLIGDETIHKPPARTWMGKYTFRQDNHSQKEAYSGYLLEHYNTTNATAVYESGTQIMYPLYNAADFRRGNGRQFGARRTITGFHVHNFFESIPEIRHKYATYGEPIAKAETVPISMVHEALALAVNCAHGWPHHGRQQYSGYHTLLDRIGTPGPIFYQNEQVRKWRHDRLQEILAQDEQVHGVVNVTCKTAFKCLPNVTEEATNA